jgi:hypothetical protein
MRFRFAAARPSFAPGRFAACLRVALLVAATATTVAAQDKRPSRPGAAPARDTLPARDTVGVMPFEADFDAGMQRMLARYMNLQFTVLAAPENVKQIARFTKRYFDELVSLGFTREEALRIVIGQRVPLPGAPR